MTRFTLVEAREYHCGRIARRLRHEHQEATLRVGIDAHRKLREMFGMSSYRRAVYADGEFVALGGVTGALVAPFGFVWLAITEEGMRKYPISLIREARRQLNYIMVTKSQLVTSLIGGDEKAKHLAVFLGFHVSHGDRGEPAFTRFGRRDLCGYLDSNPDLRVPVGNGYFIEMGYH